MDEINNDKIRSAVIKVEALQKEYEVKLLEEKARKKEEAAEKARLEKLQSEEQRKKALAEENFGGRPATQL